MKIEKISFRLFLCFCSLFLLFSPSSGKAETGELPEELKGVSISEPFIKGSSKEVGTVKQIKGKGRLVVLRRGENRACYAGEGDSVHEKDRLYTLADCSCRLEFADRNVIVMSDQSHLDIDEVYASVLEGIKRSRFGMNKGKAVFYALRLFRYKEMAFDLKTPTASIGVRGTRFGTEIQESGSGSSRNILTRAYVFEGEIDVTSLIDGRTQRLRENEILEADSRGLGPLVSDPARTRSFMESVLTGIAEIPDSQPQILRDEFRREELNRMDQMEDVRQQQTQQPPVHEIPSTGGHNR